MLKMLLSGLVWNLYIRWFVPKDLWYFDIDNGVVVVVPARRYEKVLRRFRGNLECDDSVVLTKRLAGPLEFRESDDRRSFLIFSDREERRCREHRSANNGGSAAAGSMKEFQQLFSSFRFERRSIRIPSPTYYGGMVLSDWEDPSGFEAVLRFMKHQTD